MNFVGKFEAQLHLDGSGTHPDTHHHVDSISSHAPSDAIIVPDADLLFKGDFKRSGVDLVLSKDDHELVLQDYFKGEKRAALASPDGAHLTGDLVNALTGHVEYAQADGSASVGKVIGHVTKLTGTATAVRNGVSIILNMGDNVEKGDVVQSGSSSTLGVTFIDGTVFGLASNAKMVLNEMVYDPNGSNNSTLFSLVVGTISFVAGQTAKHGDMKIDTPVATMGIRGTAVLVEIDFDIPGQNGLPEAKFQVVMEPDGTTGSYLLFEKNTLTQIAQVNIAGQQVSISNNNVNYSNTQLSPEQLKLVTDVFAQRFTDTNTKSFTQFTDSLTPQALPPVGLPNGGTATALVLFVTPATVLNQPSTQGQSGGGSNGIVPHIALAPTVVAFGNSLNALSDTVGHSAIDTASGQIRFADINGGDLPTAKATFASYTYQNSQHQNISPNDLQLKDILALEVGLVVVQTPGNNNNGTATWTYNIPNTALEFLAAGETLTLTYTAEVDSNYPGGNQATQVPFTITITGTNDAPVITTGPKTIAFSGGIDTPGGDLTTKSPTKGTLAFADPNLTDTHTVTTKLTSAVLSGAGVAPGTGVPPGPLKIFETALTAEIATDSTGTGRGVVDWQLAALPVYLADFVPKGDKVTLTYAVTVTDSQNATSTQNITVTITGNNTAAVVWIATTSGAASGGLWSDASNWETGTVPTATDDAIVITDQLIGLTPSYPVTINAPAVANSLTMNNYGTLFTNSPTLINNNTLTVGVGGISLSADSIVNNYGTITTGGLFEVLQESSLHNYGLITLNDGGDFEDSGTVKIGLVTYSGSVTNSGTIDVAAGTLNVEVAVDNTGGIFQIDPGATLQLNGAAIDGGTINDNSTIDVVGSSKIDAGATLNNGAATVESSVILTLDGMTVSGTTITDMGTIVLDDTVQLTGGAIIEGASSSAPGTITNNGTLEVAGAAELLNDTLTNASGAIIQVDLLETLTLDGTTITGGTLTINGTLDSIGISAITDAGITITNTGLIESTGGVLTIDPALPNLTLTNSGTLEANGGELDITGEQVANTGTLQAIDDSTLKLTTTTVTNTGAGTVTVESGSTLDLTNADIDGGTVGNSGTIDNLLGSNTISAAMTNTGTIEVVAGKLNLAGGLSGAGSLIIDAGTTLELAGADAQTITFAGGNGTLQLDNVAGLGFTGTIAGLSSTGGTFTITGAGDITSTSGDAIDFTASGGVIGNEADVTLTPSGAITGAANGIVVIQNGVGDLNVDPSGNVVGLAGNGVTAEDSATGIGNIFVNGGTGSATGTGTGSIGLLAENLNAANGGNITVTQLGGASGGLYGIVALTEGNGNISVEAAGAVTATVQYGIRAVSEGTGDITVTTDAGTVIDSGGAGIEALNKDATIAASADSTITVNASGIIKSGTDVNLDGSAPQGIVAGYYGTDALANTNINGTVVINNYANVTAAGSYGVEAFNVGNGDVTVNDKAGTTVSGGQYGVGAFALSGGTGNVAVNVAANATITGTSSYGIDAGNLSVGNVNVSTLAGDVINSGSTGIEAYDEATSIPTSANSIVHVIANGTINSGANLTNIGTAPAGISAGYFPGEAENPDDNVAGNVIVESNATIIAAGGDGIDVYNWGTGNVTVSTGLTSSITAPVNGIQAGTFDGGDVSVTNDGTVSGALGIYATASLAGTVSVTNSGHVTGTLHSGIYVAQDGTGSIGSTTITNTGTVLGSTADAAIAVYDNATGTVTIDNNSGTIGPAAVLASTHAIFESGGDITINNTGAINGTLYLANGTFNNELGGTWQVGGTSEFGEQSSTGIVEAFTIDNAGTIDLIDAASLSDASGLNIDNTGTIDNVSGSNTISAAVINTGAGTVTVAGGSTLTLANASITGGTVTDNGTIGITGASTLAGVTFNGAAGGTDTIDNAGTLTLGSGGLTLGGPAAFTLLLDGAGTLALNGQTIQAATAGMTLENNRNIISGAGQIGDGTTNDLTLDNASGVIEALGGMLKIATGNAVTNAATLEADGATLLVTTKILNSGVIESINGGTLDLKGGGAGEIIWTGTTPVAGSNGIVLAGSTDTLLVDSTTGQLQLNGTTADGAVSLGGGTIKGNGTTAEILDNFNNVISGYGHIGLGTDLLTLHNESAGVIDANVSGQTISIDTGSNTIVNAGTMEATAGGTLQIESSVSNSALIEANGGTVFVASTAVITGTPTVTITHGGLAEFAGSSTQTLDLNATFSGAGTLQLDHSQQYGGTISGFGVGDKIDLTDLTYSTSETDVWNSTTDTLTIYNGTHSTSLIFSGSYNQNSFSLTSDANHDTEVVLSPAQASLSDLDPSGNAVNGFAVAASLIDANASGLTYTWLENNQIVQSGNNPSFTPGAADIGKVLDVVIGFTDGGTTEQITALAGTVVAAPVVSAGGSAATTNENQPLTLSSLNVVFADAGGDTITVTLDANDGTLSLNSTVGVHESGTGLGSSPLILTGTLAAIDTALTSGVVYTPSSDFTGIDTLSFKANDGAINSNTADVSITVLAPVPPVITAPESGTTASHFVTIDDPGARQASGEGTLAHDINDSGVIVGGYTVNSQHSSGFEYDGGFSTVGVSGAQHNSADGINNLGEIVGFDSSFQSPPRHGFTDDDGSYTQINLPGAISTTANDINDAGVVVGGVHLHNSPFHEGYIVNDGVITYLDAPGTSSPSVYTNAEAINDADQVVGIYRPTNGSHDQGFLYQNGTYTTISDPNGAEGTEALGINNAGEIVGQYTDSAGKTHGFLDVDGTFTTIDDPLGVNTAITGINDAGQIVGYYQDSSGIDHGFVASLNGVSTPEDQALTLKTLSVSDPNAGTNNIEVTLDVAHGTLALAPADLTVDGLTVNGQGSDALVLTGTQTAINAALADGLTYTPTLNSQFADVLKITADDLAHNGTGAPLSTTVDVGIVVTSADSIANGATYTVSAASSDTIAFAGSTGTLGLAQPSTFTGEIAGISGSGDVLDIHGFAAATTTASTGSGSFNSLTDTTTLTVTDSSGPLTEKFTLAGNYSASTWHVSNDGHGGVDIVDPPAAAAPTIASGGSLEIADPVAAGESVTFQSSTGSLALDAPSSFAGVIFGFTGDGTLAGSDQIDLKGIDYHASTFSESFNAATDTLAVSDGTDHATLQFNGVYQAANFSFTSDGDGGTIVYDPPVSDSPDGAAGAGHHLNSHGFVFKFANDDLGATVDHTVADAHPWDGPMAANGQAAFGATHDDSHGHWAGHPDGHDPAAWAGILKAQLHANDFHFV